MAASSTYELHEKLRTLTACLRHLTWALEHFDLCSPGLVINGSSGMDHRFCAVVSSQPPANTCFTLLRSLQPHEPPFVSEAPKQPGSSRFSRVLKYNVAETQFCSKKNASLALLQVWAEMKILKTTFGAFYQLHQVSMSGNSRAFLQQLNQELSKIGTQLLWMLLSLITELKYQGELQLHFWCELAAN